MGEEKRQQRSFTCFAGREGEAVHVCQYVLADATKRRDCIPPSPTNAHILADAHVCKEREGGCVRAHTYMERVGGVEAWRWT